MREHTMRRVRRCGVHDYGTASWYQLIGVCTCIHTRCVVEEHGYHLHQIRFGDDAWSKAVITDDLHSWMPPGTTYVQIEKGKNDYRGGEDITLADAWREFATEYGADPAAVPDFPCRLEEAPGLLGGGGR